MGHCVESRASPNSASSCLAVRFAAIGFAHPVARIAVHPVPGVDRKAGDLFLTAVDGEHAVLVLIMRGIQEGVVDVVVEAQQDGDHR